MMQLKCPWCGLRDESEFVCGGTTHLIRPDAAASDATWGEYLFFRDNPKGVHRERWRRAYMASQRLADPAGRWIDRSHPLSFTFNGRQLYGFRGDTLASALLANGVRLVGRSFKLHRPRGIWSCGAEEPSALVDIGRGARRTPNVRATLLPLAEGLAAEDRKSTRLNSSHLVI